MKDSLYESHQPRLQGPELNEKRKQLIQSDLYQLTYNTTTIILAALTFLCETKHYIYIYIYKKTLQLKYDKVTDVWQKK